MAFLGGLFCRRYKTVFYAAWFLEMFQQAHKHDLARVLGYIILILTTTTVTNTLRNKHCELCRNVYG